MINSLKILGALVDLALPMQASAMQRAAMAHGAFGVDPMGCDLCGDERDCDSRCYDAESARERLVEREAEEEVLEGYSLDEAMALRDEQVAEWLKHSHRRITTIDGVGGLYRDECGCGYEMLTFSREAADREWDAHLPHDPAPDCCTFHEPAYFDADDTYEDCDYTPRPRKAAKCQKCGNDLILTHTCAPQSSPAAEAGAVACPPGSNRSPDDSPGGTTNPSHPPTTTAHRGSCGEDCGADSSIPPAPAPQYPTMTCQKSEGCWCGQHLNAEGSLEAVLRACADFRMDHAHRKTQK